MSGTEKVTHQDLADANIDKVFGEGYAADDPPAEEQTLPVAMTATARPTFGVTATEIDAAKMMAMSRMVPPWLRARPADCWAIIQLSKRWTRFDQRTNSWVCFDPIIIAQNSYLVTGESNESIGYMSQFIGALIDAFAGLHGPMLFSWKGEGEERQCIAAASLSRRGERKSLVYETPALRLIYPKKSPLWKSDPDRQLAYYARRAWARLYTPGVLMGVYDVEELEGSIVHQGADRAKDVTEAADKLRQRLAAARENGEQAEGFREGSAQEGISGSAAKPTETAAGEPVKAEAPETPIQPAKRTRSRAKAAVKGAVDRAQRGGKKTTLSKGEVKAAADRAVTRNKKARPLPKNADEYREHVRAWLAELGDEQSIEERWRVEMKLRNQCGVIEDERKAIRALIDQRIMEARQ